MVTPKTRTPADRPARAARPASESGTRQRERRVPDPLPPLDPIAEGRVYALVRRVADDDGMTLPPEWIVEADQAKRRGYLVETSMRLSLTLHGQQWLTSRDEGDKRKHTMQKLTPAANLQLKDLSQETGVPMKEAISDLIRIVHENRDRLTRYARRHGGLHPWDALPLMLTAVERGAR